MGNDLEKGTAVMAKARKQGTRGRIRIGLLGDLGVVLTSAAGREAHQSLWKICP
jgi:hypothetical protein